MYDIGGVQYDGILYLLGIDTVIWMRNRRYSVFQLPNGDAKIQFLIGNTTVTVSIQKSDYSIMVISEKICGGMVIRNLVRPLEYMLP